MLTEFGVNASCTGATLAPAGTCNMAVSFTPAGAGNRNASISVADNASGSPQTVALTGTGATAAPQANFTYPLDGQTQVDTSRPFSWTLVPAATYYYLAVGTTVGGYDLVASGLLPPSQSTYVAPALPRGRTLYGEVLTYINGGWLGQNITFTAAATHATFTYPVDGQTASDNANPFTWTSSPGATYYYLAVGTTAGGYDLVASGLLPPSQTSYAVPPSQSAAPCTPDTDLRLQRLDHPVHHLHCRGNGSGELHQPARRPDRCRYHQAIHLVDCRFSRQLLPDDRDHGRRQRSRQLRLLAAQPVLVPGSGPPGWAYPVRPHLDARRRRVGLPIHHLHRPGSLTRH